MERVLLVTEIFPPHIGGPATFIDRLGHALARAGHYVTVVCSSDRPSEQSDRQRPFRVRRVHASNPIAFQLAARAVLAREMLRHRVVLVNGLEQPAYHAARLLRRGYVLKVVGDSVWETARNEGLTIDSIDEFQSNTALDPRLQRLQARRNRFVLQADVVITPSNYLRHMVIAWGLSPDRVKTVYNGVSQEEYADYQPVRRDSPILEIVFVGRLTNWKGVETLLLAASLLEDIHVTIIGDGPELPHLADIARQLELGNKATFAGRLSASAVKEHVSRAHVLVLTSLYEGLSHTLLEASAMGVPCIASDRGGNPETIQSGETGLLIPPQNVSALRDAIERLRSDEDFRYRLACNAKEHARRFDFQTTVSETMEVLVEDRRQPRASALQD